MKINVCPGDDFKTFYASEVDRTCWTIQTHITEPDFALFMNLTH